MTALGDASIFPNRLISCPLRRRSAASHNLNCNILTVSPKRGALKEKAFFSGDISTFSHLVGFDKTLNAMGTFHKFNNNFFRVPLLKLLQIYLKLDKFETLFCWSSRPVRRVLLQYLPIAPFLTPCLQVCSPSKV